MIESSAGVVPTAGKLTFIRPLKPTQFVALMSSCVSVLRTVHVDSSIIKVNNPVASTRLEIVNATGDGGGE